jgi:hypothetical protein
MLPGLAKLRTAFLLEEMVFPDLIEAFRVEFIPSFVHHHNTLEELCDSVLSVLATLNVARTWIAGPTHRVHQRVGLAVSNGLFTAIGNAYGFESCVIGPIGEPRVPADCLEAVIGFVFLRYGYDKLSEFWQARIAGVDSRELEKCGLKGRFVGMI